VALTILNSIRTVQSNVRVKEIRRKHNLLSIKAIYAR
jgi:hypothetical protein